MVPTPTEYHHAIAIKTPDSNEQKEELLIPLSMSGVFSYFQASKPTASQYENADDD